MSDLGSAEPTQEPLAELQKLSDEATQGRWSVWHWSNNPSEAYTAPGYDVVAPNPKTLGGPLTVAAAGDGLRGAADTRFIAALVNAFRAGDLVPRSALDAVTKERDLAIAHDRQPYPTAWAYEQACRVMHEAKAELAEAREALQRVRRALQQWAQPHVREAIDIIDAALGVAVTPDPEPDDSLTSGICRCESDDYCCDMCCAAAPEPEKPTTEAVDDVRGLLGQYLQGTARVVAAAKGLTEAVTPSSTKRFDTCLNCGRGVYLAEPSSRRWVHADGTTKCGPVLSEGKPQATENP